MAKPANDRRAVIDEIRRKQKGAERRRGLAIVGVCATIAVLIVLAAAYRPVKDWWDLRDFKGKQISSIGAPASVCQKVTTKKAEGNQDHRDESEQISYPDAPPAFGPHWNAAGLAPADFSRKMYTDDRPELEALVHNLEHGYTILWYDQDVADDGDQMTQLRAIADKYTDGDNFRLKFIAAPWNVKGDEGADDVDGTDGKDGKAFPDGQHVAFSHWTSDGENKQTGVWQYCSAVSGEALFDFMLDYPYTDAPEPAAQ